MKSVFGRIVELNLLLFIFFIKKKMVGMVLRWKERRYFYTNPFVSHFNFNFMSSLRNCIEYVIIVIKFEKLIALFKNKKIV